MADKTTESSVEFSLNQLMEIEAERARSEEAAKVQKADEEARAAAEAERKAREAEEARIAAEEQKRREEEQRRSRALDATAQLAAGVAHHFNNLLTAMLGYTELLAAQSGVSREMAGDLDEILKAGRRAATLTQNDTLNAYRQ